MYDRRDFHSFRPIRRRFAAGTLLAADDWRCKPFAVGFFLLLVAACWFSIAAAAAWAGPLGLAPGRILVEPRSGVDDFELNEVLANQEGRIIGRLHQLDVLVVQVEENREEAIARVLSRHPRIAFAEPDRLVALSDVLPNDPKYASQWHLPMMKTPAAWDYSFGEEIVVAVLDTGVDGSHPDLQGKLVAGWNIYDNNADTSDVYGHGTNVAGVIGAAANNALGVASVAWSAKVMPVRISQPDGYAYFSTIANGLTWAADHGARVANISYGVSGSSSVKSAAEYMRQKGGLVCVSAGNSGALDSTPENPSVISVAATTSTDVRASFSTYGPFVDLSAPGSGILTTARGGGYASVSGTSFSSPNTAGTVALIFAANPALSPSQAETALFASADDLGTAGWDPYYGHGRVNAFEAVLAALDQSSIDTQAPAVAITSPTGGTVSGVVAVNVSASDNVGVTAVDLLVNGAVIAVDSSSPFQFSVDTRLYADGALNLSARARDAAGNQATAKTVAVTVDNQPDPADTQAPVVTIVSPASGATVTKTVKITVSAADNVKVTKLQCAIDGKVVATTTSSVLSYSWNTGKAAAGTHTIQGIAFDAAGNRGSATIQVNKLSSTSSTKPRNLPW